MTIPLAMLGMRAHSLILSWLKGHKKGSVLSPTLFLVVIDLLLRDMPQKCLGLSVHDLYVGSGGHADDIRTAAANKSSLMSQALSVKDFTKKTCLNLNAAKCDSWLKDRSATRFQGTLLHPVFPQNEGI